MYGTDYCIAGQQGEQQLTSLQEGGGMGGVRLTCAPLKDAESQMLSD